MTRARNLMRVGSRALMITTVVREARQARRDGDKLRLLDALVNGLAVVIAVAIIVREIREHSGNADAAIEEAQP